MQLDGVRELCDLPIQVRSLRRRVRNGNAFRHAGSQVSDFVEPRISLQSLSALNQLQQFCRLLSRSERRELG